MKEKKYTWGTNDGTKVPSFWPLSSSLRGWLEFWGSGSGGRRGDGGVVVATVKIYDWRRNKKKKKRKLTRARDTVASQVVLGKFGLVRFEAIFAKPETKPFGFFQIFWNRNWNCSKPFDAVSNGFKPSLNRNHLKYLWLTILHDFVVYLLLI